MGSEVRIQVPIIDQHGDKIGEAEVSLASLFVIEAHVDEDGVAWTPPTAWAYMRACQKRDRYLAFTPAKPEQAPDAGQP